MQCTIANIASAAVSVSNNLDSSFRLVKALSDENEIDDALVLIINSSLDIADMLASAAISHYNDYPTLDDVFNDCSVQVVHAAGIHKELEKLIVRHFPYKTDYLVATKKRLYNYMSQTEQFFDEDYLYKETKRLVDEVKKYEPTYNEAPIRRYDQSANSASSNTQLSKSGGCYIATAIYGSYDCPQVWTLRRFRDYTLAETWYGRVFIHSYYAISPILVRWFGGTEWFRNMCKPWLDRMVERLSDQGIADTPYIDKK